jgi:hypothetical protein
MKHLISFALLLMGLSASAQTIMNIYQNNGTVLQIPLSSIDSITYTVNNPGNLATLTTLPMGNITATSAVSGGNITNDGGTPVTQRGVCWSTSPNPTTANNTTSDGSGVGSYTSTLTGLVAGSTYYVRAYAINSAGTAYGNQVQFTAASDSEPTLMIFGEIYYVLSGNITSSRTLISSRRWLISGGVFVNFGATLTIEEGTRLYAADDATTPFLSIQRGGRINAVGTASNPIVFTTIKTVTGGAARGDWGGIILNGFAPINICVTADCTAEGEGGSGVYGGTDPNDNSGTMKFVRVEYAGKILGTENELNGFSFNGVGAQTVLEHLQAFKGSGDGFEFFGGTVNLKWAVSTGNSDDSFDWTHGWRGKGQFWVVQQDAVIGDNGMECDNWETNYTVTPFSEPMISNFTLVGADDGIPNHGMRLRHGTKGKLYNGIVTGFIQGVRVGIECDAYVADGSLALKNSSVFGNTTAYNNAAAFESDATNSSSNIGLNGYVGSDAAGAVDPLTLDSWFSTAPFKGAVEAGNDWTSGWTIGL